MSGIALYNTLRKIPEVSEAEAKEAVADVASSKEVATKADLENLETRLIEKMAKLEARIFKQLIVGAGIIIAAMVGLKIFS